jgi:hypothetical protein
MASRAGKKERRSWACGWQELLLVAAPPHRALHFTMPTSCSAP